jgi:hypothetical protein
MAINRHAPAATAPSPVIERPVHGPCLLPLATAAKTHRAANAGLAFFSPWPCLQLRDPLQSWPPEATWQTALSTGGVHAAHFLCAVLAARSDKPSNVGRGKGETLECNNHGASQATARQLQPRPPPCLPQRVTGALWQPRSCKAVPASRCDTRGLLAPVSSPVMERRRPRRRQRYAFVVECSLIARLALCSSECCLRSS